MYNKPTVTTKPYTNNTASHISFQAKNDQRHDYSTYSISIIRGVRCGVYTFFDKMSVWNMPWSPLIGYNQQRRQLRGTTRGWVQWKRHQGAEDRLWYREDAVRAMSETFNLSIDSSFVEKCPRYCWTVFEFPWKRLGTLCWWEKPISSAWTISNNATSWVWSHWGLHPWLSPSWNLDAVRCPRCCNVSCFGPPKEAASPSWAFQFLCYNWRKCAAGTGCTNYYGKLCDPQAWEGSLLVCKKVLVPCPLYPDLLLLTESGRNLLRDHKPLGDWEGVVSDHQGACWKNRSVR